MHETDVRRKCLKKHEYPHRLFVCWMPESPSHRNTFYNEVSKSLMYQSIRDMRNNNDHWWVVRCIKMRKAGAMSSSYNDYWLIWIPAVQKLELREAIKKSDSSVVHSQCRRLECWTERFNEQVSWLNSTAGDKSTLANEIISVDASTTKDADDRNFISKYIV